MVPFVRSAYNYDRDAASDESGLRCEDPTLAQQHFRDECDINTIMERFGQTGQLPEVRMPQYGDFTGISDYHQAMNAVVEAQESFMQLPAKVRARFENDPGQFVEFCLSDSPENRAEAERLGLVEPKPPTPEGAPSSTAAQSST